MGVRLFVSVELPERIRHQLAAIQKTIKRNDFFEGRFVQEADLHATLVFIGEIDEISLEPIKESLSKIKFEPFEVCLGYLQVHPSIDMVRLLWIDLISAELTMLAKKIQEALKPRVRPEEREFSGHLTIARVKKMIDRQGLDTYLRTQQPEKHCFTVSSFALKRSILSQEGPEHTLLATFNA